MSFGRSRGEIPPPSEIDRNIGLYGIWQLEDKVGMLLEMAESGSVPSRFNHNGQKRRDVKRLSVEKLADRGKVAGGRVPCKERSPQVKLVPHGKWKREFENVRDDSSKD